VASSPMTASTVAERSGKPTPLAAAINAQMSASDYKNGAGRRRRDGSSPAGGPRSLDRMVRGMQTPGPGRATQLADQEPGGSRLPPA